MKQEDTALQVAWEEWLAAHPDRSTAGPVYRPGFEAGWAARQQVIDSLTAERDRLRTGVDDFIRETNEAAARWAFTDAGSAEDLYLLTRSAIARAEAAEAEVKRLRELARKVLGQISARHSEDHWLCEETMPVADCDRCELAALATPPSEGG